MTRYTDPSKSCIDCGQALGFRNTHKRCKRHFRAYHAYKTSVEKYAITVQQYEDMSRSQGHLCKICLSPPIYGDVFRLSIDHDHKTGRVRGLLCNRCNCALGQLDDSIERLEACLAYLKEHRGND